MADSGNPSPMAIDSQSDSDSDSDDWSPPGSPGAPGAPPPPPGVGSPADESSSNSNIQNEADDWVELTESNVVSDEKAALLLEFERKRRARQMHVPTDDKEVGNLLRLNGAPFCLFGEGPAERRDRLKDVLSRLSADEQQFPSFKRDDLGLTEPHKAEETWYHTGPERLKAVRQFVLEYSIPKARERLAREKKYMSDITAVSANKQECTARLRRFQLQISQNADTRPVSCIRFSPDGSKLASASWSGSVQVWNVDGSYVDGKGEGSHLLRGHEGQVDSVAWHPDATLSHNSSQLNLASCGRDGSVYLWGLDSESPLAHLPNMGSRVTDVTFHPSGRLLALSVEDMSWRLWEIEGGEEVLFQEGHSKSVACISMQKDGALAATGGKDSFGRVWDLRTGRCVMFLPGHQSAVLCLDWSPDGYHLATGSQDNTVKIWDVRQRALVHTIPAHTSIVSGVKYDPTVGNFIATCSYDGTVRLWPQKSSQLLKTMEGHGHKVMSVDISPDGLSIATSAFDKTYKIWGPD